MASSEEGPSGGPAGTVRVGYGLREKRAASFLAPELLALAKEKGVEFVKIDPGTPLEDQGPFNLILHKLDSEEWAQNLTSFERNHPDVVIVDNYENVHKLDDRREMLQAVEKLDQALGAHFGVPRQLVVDASVKAADIAAVVEKEGFQLPAVAKPVAANGTNSSHLLSLVLEPQALAHLETPVILQEFVNHGGVLFKLYILGDKVMVFRRNSLPDIQPGDDQSGPQQVVQQLEQKSSEALAVLVGPTVKEPPKEKKGLVELSRISNVHLTPEELMDNRVTDPPPELMRSLGMALKQLLGLHAFNVDILREGGHGEKYYIVDINYMPGYERIPDFPNLFIDFVLTRVAARKATLAQEAAGKERENLLKQELSGPVTTPVQPYPGLQGKKKWVYFKAAMKMFGLEQRSRQPAVKETETEAE